MASTGDSVTDINELIATGSVLVSGSNPNSDSTNLPNITYQTEYRTERFFPLYYNERRPEPIGLIRQLTYGGPYFNVTLDSNDLFGDVGHVQNASVVIIRPGFSTHAMVRPLSVWLLRRQSSRKQ